MKNAIITEDHVSYFASAVFIKLLEKYDPCVDNWNDCAKNAFAAAEAFTDVGVQLGHINISECKE